VCLETITNMSSAKRITSILVLAFILSSAFYLALPRRLLFVEGKTLFVELARTPHQQQKGLQHRKTLGENRGMLFIFPVAEEHNFWMKETYIPLDIAFIDKNKVIIDIQKMQPLDIRTQHHAHANNVYAKTKYALEVNAGWFEENKIRVGSRVYF